MGRPKYPLEPLAELRAKNVDEATKVLAEKTRARETASRARQSHEKAAEEHEAATRRVVDAEQGALLRGELRAADLLAQQAWASRVKAEQAELDLRARAAREAEEARRREEAEAREATARRKADADVVDKDRARFVRRHEEQAVAREEEDALDVWNGRRG